MGLNIGIGITNDCNLNCGHCYSRTNGVVKSLSYDVVIKIIDNIDIDSINFGTGESILHKDFVRIIEYLDDKKIKFSLTSNGYSIKNLPDEILKKFSDIDISYDFPNKWENNLFRGPASGDLVFSALDRLRSLGVETSIATCMTNLNFHKMDEMVKVARKFDVNLRVNIYKPVNKESLNLSYDSFWKGVELLLGSSRLISCSEPIVNTILGTKILDGGCPCGKNSIRITPDGLVVPCVYWKNSDATIDTMLENGVNSLWKAESFKKIREIPAECNDCPYIDICKGGCAARRYYASLDKPDPYCYVVRGDQQPKLKWEMAEHKDLVHSSYLCTFIVK